MTIPDAKQVRADEWQAVKDARHHAHKLFDELCITGRMSRKQAYEWLAKVMQMTQREAHVARFDLAQCERLVLEVRRLRKRTARND